MVHEFNDNGYVYTERELHSGKYYKIIMKKAYKISSYHNMMTGRDNKLKQIQNVSEAENTTETDNIESQKIELIQEVNFTDLN